eukprot:jgi/Phyca11/21859/fgenesh1_pg.PHYCAscaffold_165_\
MTSDWAKWNEDQVKKFLDAFLEARNNPSYKADKGIKAKGWTDIVKKLNAEFEVEREKAQYKSKLDRIMNDYDLFKCISGLSGVVTEYFEMKIAPAKRSEAGSKDCEDYDDTGFSPSHSP